MKEIRFNHFGPAKAVAQCVETVAPTNPSAWEVIVKVEAFPINPADTAMMLGQYGFLNQPPATIGMEAAGTIIEVGRSVSNLQPGDPVVILANNNWAQYRKVPATLVVKTPENSDLQQMAMVKVTGLTAFKLLTEMTQLKPGDFIVQNAPLSAVGQVVIKLAQHLNLKTINLVRSVDQIGRVLELGGGLAYVDNDEVVKNIRAEIGKTPLRLALDCVGGDSTERLAQCLNDNGLVVNYGMLSFEPCRISPEHLIFRNVNLSGFWLSRVLNKMSAVDRANQVSDLANLICEGKLAVPIDSVYPIEKIADAIQRSEQPGRHGKVIVAPHNA